MKRPTQITFRVSGVAMAVIEGSGMYQNPDRSQREASKALQGATHQRRGRGSTYLVTATIPVAAVIADYCKVAAQALGSGGADPHAARDAQALRYVVSRIDWQTKKAVGSGN